jgi:uncharacterized protein (TIGR01777 family)
MEKQKIIITAANGFLGRALAHHLKGKYDIVGLVRKPLNDEPGIRYVIWDGKTLGDWQAEFEGAYCLINMAGRSVDCRYNEQNKKEILESRLESTNVLGQAVDLCKKRPEVWMNSASATIYRHSLDMPMTESRHEIGTGFSVGVCQSWEKAFFDFTYSDVRQVALRTTIVLGANGGAFHPMKQLAKFGVGGKQGKGDQMLSWIHVDDFCHSVEFILNTPTLKDSVNMAAPYPVPNAQFMLALRKAVGRSFGIPMPAGLLKLGARIIKTEAELILKSRYVIPEKLTEAGYVFKYPTVQEAFENILK